MHRLMVFLPIQCVLATDDRGRDGGRLKPLTTFLSLMHINVQESPPVYCHFHFGPWTLNFVYGPNLCYISFDFVRLGPSIAIN